MNAIAHPHPDQQFLVDAAKTLRQAVREFRDGDLQAFLFSIKRAAFLTGMHSGHTPSETRVMRATNRALLAACARMRIVEHGKEGTA